MLGKYYNKRVKTNYKIDWVKAEQSYLLDNIPYRELARQLGVSRQSVEIQGKKRQWAEKKNQINSGQQNLLTRAVKEAQLESAEVIRSEVGAKLGHEIADRISQIKHKQISDSEVLIGVGMERMTSGKPVSDAVALASIKHGQETIRELEGMRKVDNVTNVLIIDPVEALQRLRAMQEELRDVPLHVEEVNPKIEYPNE